MVNREVLVIPVLGLIIAACGDTASSSSSGSSGDSGGGSTSSSGGDAGQQKRTVGGTVTGLKGKGLILQNNAGDDVALSADGSFKFPTTVAAGAAYAVTVKAQPSTPTQTCSVAKGTGTIDAADVTSVEVTCATTAFTVGGTVTGISGGSVVLQNNGADDLTVSAAGVFTFASKVASDGAYAVTVKTQPSAPPQTCTVSTGTGTVASADVTDVQIACAPAKFDIGGMASGLGGGTVVLQNNGADDLSVAANGAFKFATRLLSAATYAVTVKTHPAGKKCAVTKGSGAVAAANITDIDVTCLDIDYYLLTGNPTHTTVFNTIDQTYTFGNNLTNLIWNGPANKILAGHFASQGYWSFAAATSNYPNSPNNDTANTFTRMVQVPDTSTAIFSKAGSLDGVGPGTAANIMVATIDKGTGLLSGKATAVFSDNYAGNCNLHSSSATEFLCYIGGTVRKYTTTAGSANLTYVSTINLSQTLPMAAECLPNNACYGSTFAFDGAYFYFATHQGSSNNLNYEVYTAAGAFVATDTATGSGAINGVYFDWSVGRYATHDGFGNRSGGVMYTGGGGNDDSHSYGAVSAAHGK